MMLQGALCRRRRDKEAKPTQEKTKKQALNKYQKYMFYSFWVFEASATPRDRKKLQKYLPGPLPGASFSTLRGPSGDHFSTIVDAF